MALSSGTQFGSYEIAGEIGAGGMGVVYRARDSKLDREVAIKVLPESMAADAERLARFDREAKTLASLNHPNIAQIYGLEESGGTTALVLELVEGPTLADRIEQGALSVDEALGIAMQIAAALEAAHGQGIIHRDLKPANIKLRPDGTVKVLDFGIAKALEPENLVSGPQSPIVTTPATQAGVILGTAAYMSPEQAKGKPIDQRTDVWAFACVLYEMLTGQMVFGAEDVPTTLARVIANEPDIDSLPGTISPAVRQTIALCLQKDPRKRVRDIGDVQLALEGAFETVSPQVAEAVTAQPLWRRALPVATGALVAGVVVGFGGQILRPQSAPEPQPVNRFDFDLPEAQRFRETNRRIIELSSNGRHFVYNTTDGLYLRAMGELETRLIPGTEASSSSPSVSPDGQWVVYADLVSDQLKRIAISGGAPVVVASLTENPDGMTWSTDNTILYEDDGIYRVSANGGTPELVIPLQDGEVFYGSQLLPDGDSVLFAVGQAGGPWSDVGAQIVVQSLSSGERSVLVEGGSEARYLPSGHLIYALDDGLFAVTFDTETLSVSGGAVPLVQGVMRGIGGGGNTTASANYFVSENGTLVYVRGSVAETARTLVWVDRNGREEPVDAPPRTYNYPRISPDGTRVALDVRDEEFDIWSWDLARETLTRLTFDPGQDEFPVWSPDSQRIAFSLTPLGITQTNMALLWRAADGTGPVERLVELDGGGQIYPSSFLPDGTGILVRSGANNADDIAIVPLDGEDGVTPLLERTFNEFNAEVSPDGRWLAYTSDESGSNEIYVRPFPEVDSGGRWQVSAGGGRQPLWAQNGRELFYRDGEAVIAVSIDTDPSFAAGNPEVVFQGPYFGAGGGRSYDVSLDGERFLMIKPVESSTETPQIVIVENWFEELNRLAPPQQ